MFDTLTADELFAYHLDLFREHTRRWQRCAALPVLHPDYPLARAAMDEIGETMHAVGAEISRRSQQGYFHA